MKPIFTTALFCAIAASGSLTSGALANGIPCGDQYTVVRGDTLSGISMRSYGSFVYQPVYNANIDVIGTNPDMIYPDQSFLIPCLN